MLQEVTSRPIFLFSWKPELRSIEVFESYQQIAIFLIVQPRRHMDLKIGINTYQVRIEGDMVQCRHADPILNQRGATFGIGYNMSTDQ